MTPDATRHNPDPQYLRQLLQAAGLNQQQAAERLGITDRTLRYYLSDTDSAGYREATYLVQFALERLAAAAIELIDSNPAVLVAAPDPSTTAGEEWRPITDADVAEQAPVGMDWDEAEHAVWLAVRERFEQLPACFHDAAFAPGASVSVFPPAAIEPALFDQVMRAHEQLRAMQHAKAHVSLSELWNDIRRTRHPLIELLAIDRLLAVLRTWQDMGVLTYVDIAEQRYKALERRERVAERVAEQARRYDPNVVPWAYREPVESPLIELQQAPRFAGKVGQRRLRQAEAEWQAQHLEKQAATLVSNADALRHRWGGALQTAGALRSVSRHISERTEAHDD